MSSFKSFVVAAAVGYLALVAVMYVAQRAIMYFPERIRTPPGVAGFPQAEEILLDTADGERLIAWHVPPREEKPVVLYFHGNGGALRHRVPRFHALIDGGGGLLALSYRGYAGSTGRPSEEGLLADGAAAYGYAAAHYPADRIALWGESLGTGIAVALAAEKPITRMVLEAPFTSAVDVAAGVYWYLPVRLLMKDQFRSDLRIGKVTAPVLILHGDRDRVVPFSQGEGLYALINAPKRFVRLAGGGHEGLDALGAMDAAREFLSKK